MIKFQSLLFVSVFFVNFSVKYRGMIAVLFGQCSCLFFYCSSGIFSFRLDLCFFLYERLFFSRFFPLVIFSLLWLISNLTWCCFFVFKCLRLLFLYFLRKFGFFFHYVAFVCFDV